MTSSLINLSQSLLSSLCSLLKGMLVLQPTTTCSLGTLPHGHEERAEREDEERPGEGKNTTVAAREAFLTRFFTLRGCTHVAVMLVMYESRRDVTNDEERQSEADGGR